MPLAIIRIKKILQIYNNFNKIDQLYNQSYKKRKKEIINRFMSPQPPKKQFPFQKQILKKIVSIKNNPPQLITIVPIYQKRLHTHIQNNLSDARNLKLTSIYTQLILLLIKQLIAKKNVLYIFNQLYLYNQYIGYKNNICYKNNKVHQPTLFFYYQSQRTSFTQFSQSMISLFLQKLRSKQAKKKCNQGFNNTEYQGKIIEYLEKIVGTKKNSRLYFRVQLYRGQEKKWSKL
eukprot:TRINITY_DN1564_c0_g2_i5.p1 TRINITY_DN1564_c0_g2~~TRINITY_DN1564_c0_g2_i5.p1  ORF type:complete len:232 (+),score=-7.11 TRINITY_DN1564_c0_g2_i5:406-1101(+)